MSFIEDNGEAGVRDKIGIRSEDFLSHFVDNMELLKIFQEVT
jgi:hypothetical protein